MERSLPFLGDGSVVTWRDSRAVQGRCVYCRPGRWLCRYSDDCSAVQRQLANVWCVRSCNGAFAANLGDDSVVTWDPADLSGDGCVVRRRLGKVMPVQSSFVAFTAILDDGYVVYGAMLIWW